MKSCPTCKRTFDDTMTFCLVDGSILSVPFDPNATQHLPVTRDSDSPPTEVMSSSPGTDTLPPTQPALKTIDVVPTITSSIPIGVPKQIDRKLATDGKRSKRVMRTIALVIGLSLVIIFLYAGLRWYQPRSANSLATPSSAARTFQAAVRNKDVENFKRSVSQSFLEPVAGAARNQGVSLDAYVKLKFQDGFGVEGDIQEIRNENISGDRATLEAKIKDEWHRWIFVRENGEWKFYAEQ